MSRKFREILRIGESMFGGSEKERYFLKILKWQHKLVWDYKRGKLVSYFLNNAAKICSYGLKILENIKIQHMFPPKVFFHLSGNLHTSCFSAFNLLAHFVRLDKYPLNSIYCTNLEVTEFA